MHKTALSTGTNVLTDEEQLQVEVDDVMFTVPGNQKPTYGLV